MFAEISPTLVLALVTGCFIVGIIWWRPMWGLFFYLGSTGLDYLIALAGFNTSGLFSVGQVMLVILLGFSMLRWRMTYISLIRPCWGLFFAIGGFVLTMWLSAWLGVCPENSYSQAAVITATVSLPFILVVLVDNDKRMKQLMWAFGLGVTLSAGIGFLQFAEVLQVVSHVEAASAEDSRGVVAEYRSQGSGSAEGKRYAGPTRNPNGFATVLMGGLPAIFFLVTRSRGILAKTLAMSAMALCAFALLLTMSRTHIIGFLVFLGLMTVFTSSASWGKRLLYWSLAMVALAGFVFALSRMDGVGERLLAGVRDGGDDSSEARMLVMWGGVVAWQSNPFFGIGLSNTEIAGYNVTGNAAHDIVAGVLGELGGIGALMFAFIVWNAFKLIPSAKAFAKNGNSELAGGCSVARAVLLVILFSGFGSKVFDNRAFWVWIGVCAVLHRLVEFEAMVGSEVGGGPVGEKITASVTLRRIRGNRL